MLRPARQLIGLFLKPGFTAFGGPAAHIAFMKDEVVTGRILPGLVHQWHWITEPQLLDAIAVGQLTPGPLFTTATFRWWESG
jgi:chromate transporter